VSEIDRVVADAIAGSAFSGAVRIDRNGETIVRVAHGDAHRAHGIPNRPDTRFGIASGTKGFTALTVVSLIAEGVLDLATTARSLLGDDLPLVGDDVTVEHLLAHRSGIGDYFDEEVVAAITDHVLPVPVHQLDCTEAYLAVLGGHPAKAPAGERFAYSNSGYVILALLAERATGATFPALVHDYVCAPAGLIRTGFLRADELPGDAAIGYLDGTGDRSNVFHLPVIGTGDGGMYSTVDDMARFWAAFTSGQIVAPSMAEDMIRPRSNDTDEGRRYGLGFWLPPDGSIVLEGYDAGVSFTSAHQPASGLTWTVMSNTADGAWPLARMLADQLRD
jgi:CubicO group peptidase (beta-lactamase class C family)